MRDIETNPDYLVVDLFCGAGGVTIGFDKTNGVAKVIAAVNHDPLAIESHWINHPDVLHFEEDIRTLNLEPLIECVRKWKRKYPNARLILWASLECTNFSKAKGGQPRDADSRTLADHLHRYIDALCPHMVMIENVVEFMSWGPLDEKGKPISKKCGMDFIRWCREMREHGYVDEWRELNSADFGARTSRNRLFGIFARSMDEIAWPEPTHAKKPKNGNLFESLKPWEPCRPCLDLDDKGTSIFTPGKIKSEKTFERVLAGCIKFVAGAGYKEFISKYYTGNDWNRNHSLDEPASVIPTNNRMALVQPDFLLKYNSTDAKTGEHRNASVESPAPALTVQQRIALSSVEFLSKYHGNGANAHNVDGPCPTLDTGDRVAKVSAEWLDRQFGNGSMCQSMEIPAGTLTTIPKLNVVQVEPFITDTNFNNIGQKIDQPLGTITANRKWHYLMNPQWFGHGSDIEKPCFTLIARMDKAPPYLVLTEEGHVAIEVYDTDMLAVKKLKHFMSMYGIADIKMRMLKVSELKKIQGFPEDYMLKGNQSQQKKFIGNSVVPDVVTHWTLALQSRLKIAA